MFDPVAYQKVYRAEHKEEAKAYQKKYRSENKETLKLLRKINHERIRAINAKYRKDNVEEIKEYQRKYREEHREEAREYQRKYRLKYQTKPVPIAGVISRKEAKAKGLKLYYTGKRCINGHLAERMINNGCCECFRVRMLNGVYKKTKLEPTNEKMH